MTRCIDEYGVPLTFCNKCFYFAQVRRCRLNDICDGVVHNSTRKTLILNHKHPVHKGPLSCFTRLLRCPVAISEGFLSQGPRTGEHSDPGLVRQLEGQLEGEEVQPQVEVFPGIPVDEEAWDPDFGVDAYCEELARSLPAEELFGDGSGPGWAGLLPDGTGADIEDGIALCAE